MVAKKAQKNLKGFNGIRTHDLCDTGVMLYQLSYEVSMEAFMYMYNMYMAS